MNRPDKKIQKLDATALKFLGATKQEIQVREGQKADQNKLRDQKEKYLLREACDYGDAIVRYTVAHKAKLNVGQLVWSFVLGLLCVRDEYPEGGAKFDDLADQAGEDLQLPPTKEDEEDEEHVYQCIPLTANEEKNAAQFAEIFAKYLTSTKHRNGLSNPQAAYGLGRAFHTLRRGYPVEEGGETTFDIYAAWAGKYFDDNKKG